MTKTTTDTNKVNPFDIDLTTQHLTDEEFVKALSILESRVEALGKTNELSSETAEYVKLLRSEERSNWWIRLGVLALLGGFLFSLWWHLLSLILNHSLGLWLIGENARVALIAGISIMTTLFMVTVLRGVYRIANERHAQRMPEHLAAITRVIGESSN